MHRLHVSASQLLRDGVCNGWRKPDEDRGPIRNGGAREHKLAAKSIVLPGGVVVDVEIDVVAEVGRQPDRGDRCAEQSEGAPWRGFAGESQDVSEPGRLAVGERRFIRRALDRRSHRRELCNDRDFLLYPVRRQRRDREPRGAQQAGQSVRREMRRMVGDGQVERIVGEVRHLDKQMSVGSDFLAQEFQRGERVEQVFERMDHRNQRIATGDSRGLADL
jgi:hypothetical protein